MRTQTEDIMGAAVSVMKRCDVGEFVGQVLAYLSERECSVPEAVLALWDENTLSESAMDELARSGAIGRVNDALHHRRFASDDADTVPVRNLLSSSGGGPSTVTVHYRSLDVQYTTADGSVCPVRKFLLVDVDSALARLTAEIEGKTRVREWFALIRAALVKHKKGRVGDLPASAKAAIDRAAPDGEEEE